MSDWVEILCENQVIHVGEGAYRFRNSNRLFLVFQQASNFNRNLL